MADRTLKAGDTWPPLRGTAGDETTPAYDLSGADQLTVIIKHSSGAPLMEVTPVPIDPVTNNGFNWEYQWQDGDTDVVGTYTTELEIVWDSGTTPPHVQTVPHADFREFVIADDLGGTR